MIVVEADAYQEHEEFLEHYGRKGMKWGQHIFAKAKSVFQSRISDYRAKKLRKKRVKTLKKARKVKVKKAVDAKKAAQRRAKILKSPTKLLKNKDQFTREEINDAIKDFEMTKRLRELSASELSAGKEYLDVLWKTVNSGSMAYNQAARIYNSFADKENKLPYIENIPGGEKKKDKNK